MSGILNLNKTYKQQPLMFGDEPGIFDTIHVNTEVKEIAERAVAQMWTAEEFDFKTCVPEFAEDNDGRDMMVDTILWQWSADSAACNLYTLLQPFISDDMLTQLVLFNTYMETLHSETYSEIVKNGFQDPEKALNDIVQRTDVLSRLSKVNEVFAQLRQAGLDFSTGKRVLDASLLADVYKGVVALYLMERVQFLSSFAITFSLGHAGRFQPVVQAVRKICADETIIHAETDVLILKDLRNNPYWNEVNIPEFTKEIHDLMEEVINRELEWTDMLFEGRSLVGITPDLVKQWVLYNYQAVRKTLGFPVNSKYKSNPLKFMENYVSMNKLQSSPQEQELGQYLVGAIEYGYQNVSEDMLDKYSNPNFDYMD